MKKSNVLDSPRLAELKKHRRKIFQRKIAFYVFIFLAVIVLLVYISRLSILNISEIQITGNKVIETETLKTVVAKHIQGNYFYFFPKTNIFFYPKDAIENDLQSNFKRLKDITLTIQNKKVLAISMTEREAIYTWCGDVLPAVDNTGQYKCYFMDDKGYIFDEAPYFSGNVYFRFFGTIDNMGNILGSSFMPDKFANLLFFKKSLEGMGLKPTAFFVNNFGELNVFFSTQSMLPNGPVFMLKMDSDFSKVIENLEASLMTEPLKTNLKTKFYSLEYIDLRFGNKVYFKFK